MAAKELFLDLSHDARRQFIRDELFSRLDVGARTKVTEILENCGIPDDHHRNYAAVVESIEAAQVSPEVKQHAQEIYYILAQAEAKVHECTIDDTHFHEVGNGEAIKNVLGICLALEALAPDMIVATPVQTGSGKVQCAHGVLDIPAPATAAILERGIPCCTQTLEGEFCTPTSAAVILHYVGHFVDETGAEG